MRSPHLQWSDGAAGPLLALFGDDDRALGWQDFGLCGQTDPEVFFPQQGENPRAAKKVCAQCFVRDECLEYAVADTSLEGVWGGTTIQERRTIRRKRGEVAA